MSTTKANLLGKRKAEDDVETEPVLKKPKEVSEEKETRKEQIEGRVEKSDESNLVSVKDRDETPDFVEEAAETVEGLNVTPIIPEESAVSKKTLFVSRLPPHSEILDIIDFFKDVGQVVRVRLQLSRKDKYTTQGFVEFASSNQAKKALEKKKGEYLHNREIRLDVANKGARCLPPKYCIDHKIWYEEDYLQQQESLPIKEDETPRNIAKAVDTLRSNKTLFIANLSPQTTKISHIIDFFGDIAEVDSVRLIVNHKGKHVGYGFVEFASPYEANQALVYMNGEYLHDHKIFLMKGLDETPDFAEAVAIGRNKTLFIAGLSRRTKISDIIHFFKDVGQVVHVRLIVDRNSRHVGFGFVEFASANEAAKALEKKNGEYLNNYEIFLDVVKAAPYPERSKYCIDHKVWYEDYPQRESLMIEEDAGVEGLDETPAIVEKKTVFAAALAMKKDTLCYPSKIIKWFKSVGEVVRVRMIGDDRGELLGCGFVEFASAKEAKKAVHEKNGFSSYVQVAETYAYPFRPKYNIPDLAKKLWYEDNLRREGFGLPKPKLVKHTTFQD